MEDASASGTFVQITVLDFYVKYLTVFEIYTVYGLFWRSCVSNQARETQIWVRHRTSPRHTDVLNT